MSNKHEFQPRKVEKLFTSLRIGAGAPKFVDSSTQLEQLPEIIF